MRLRWIRATVQTYFFWPSIAVAGLAVGMALWALTLWREDWAGQVMWSVFFALAAAGLFTLALRESRPETRRRA